MPTLQRDGVTLHYRDEGQGTCLLLLHAFPLSAELFVPQFEAFSQKFRVVAPDLRGFGKSTVGAGPTDMSTFAADAFALLDALGIGQAVVGGVSMGGYAAMAMLRLDPSRIKGLVLVDTHARADDDEGKARREELARRTEREGMEALIESMVPKLIAPDADPAVRARVERIVRAGSPEGAAAALRGMARRADSREILGRFAGPTLVAIGEKDAITPLERAREMAELVHGARLVTIPNAGHLSNLEAPAAFNRAMGEFLAALR